MIKIKKIRMRKEQLHRITFWGVYTAVFCILASILNYLFLLENKSFVWYLDGVAQHVVALQYIRGYLLDFLRTGALPMVDFSIGQGFDVIGTLNYYGFGDPLTLLTVFFPESALEEMYQFLILFRMYLGGLFFAHFCKVIGKTKTASVLPASILYAFCNFALLGGIRHPLFLNGVMYLPLLLAGVEKIIQKKRMGTLVVVVAISFITNYYFMYMNTVIAAIYFFVRQLGTKEERTPGQMFMAILKIILSYLWGIALSGVIFFPALYAFLNNARGDSIIALPPIFYEPKYYHGLINSLFISFRYVNHWAIPGIGILGIFAFLIVLIRGKKEERKMLVGCGIFLVMMCLPMIGKLMNGFAYSTNRFSYGMAMLLAVMLVYAIEDLREFESGHILKLVPCTIPILAYIIYCAYTMRFGSAYVITAVLLVAGLICIIVYTKNCHKPCRKVLAYLFTVLASVNLAFNFVTIFNWRYSAYCKEFLKKGTVASTLNSSTIELLREQKGDRFYRTERDRDFRNRNALYDNVYGMTYYYSITPDWVKDLYDSTGIADFYKPFELTSIENRSGLLSLACTKYYATASEKNIPFGFEKLRTVKDENGNKVTLYQNNYALPLGVTYTSFMTREKYDHLRPEKKEQALLTAAVVEDDVAGISKFKKHIDGVITEQPVVYPGKHVTVKKHKIRTKKNSKLNLKFSSKKGYEMLLVLDRFKAKDDHPDEQPIDYRTRYSEGTIRVKGTERNDYFPRKALIANLGYSKGGQTQCTIKFHSNRTYNYNGIYVAYVSTKEYAKRIAALKKDSLRHIRMSTNTIKGTIYCHKKEILQLAVPYSSGYSVYVDGKKTETFSSGIAYMGVKLSKGKHRIEVKYVSPGIEIGRISTILSGLILIVYFFVSGKKMRRREQIEFLQKTIDKVV